MTKSRSKRRVDWSFTGLIEYLRKKDYAVVCNNTEVWRIDTKDPTQGIGVHLHHKHIATVFPTGEVHIRTCGWDTVTTADRLNLLLRTNVEHGYITRTGDWMRYIDLTGGSWDMPWHEWLKVAENGLVIR